MRLVMQVCSYHGGIASILAGEHHPVRDPARLREVVGVPEFGLRVCIGAMLVENNPQATPARRVDDLVHERKAAQATEVWVDGIVDIRGLTRGIEELIAIRQADRIEAERGNLVEHALIVADIEPVWSERPCLKAKPIHA